ncbi:glycosyltransferase [Histidinibacterium lentulum]|uniref:Glycosyltransferase n=1 Tax=Histidinibacterium lentulum TaxID=2480588 RepID=A0A3N2R6G7_9RHOB|nr:glycosyltransferase [Histidinibacterium lentulum]ROU02993.1 glycosyltransferase [Histidinibacterium lentulum]
MIRQIRALFARYATVKLARRVRSRQLVDTAGTLVGYLESIRIEQGELRVEGWARASRVTLFAGGDEVETTPLKRREDVSGKTGSEAEVGFFVALPCSYYTLCEPRRMGLVAEPRVGGRQILSVIFPRRRLRLAAILSLAPGFVFYSASALPAAIGWFVTGDPRYRKRIKDRLRLQLAPRAGRLTPEVFADAGAGSTPDRLPGDDPVTIIVPIYNAFDLLAEMLARVSRHTTRRTRLILVDDGSSDARVRPFLRDWAAGPEAARLDRVDLLENAENLGFIGSVNRGFALALAEGAGPVVLLNSDAFLPEGWDERLLAPLADSAVASVTAMSNDAEIFSVPSICVQTPIAPGQGDAIDAVARGLTGTAVLAEAPTGVGFCMAISREWLAKEPAFDTVFGRGYGEEVDWCQKIRARGGRHLGHGGVFVEHRGGQSFGSQEKLERVARNNAIVSSRYPPYDREVQDFIAADPLLTCRMALALGWAASIPEQPRLPVYLAHTMGGGAESYLMAQIAADLADGRPSTVLRVGGPTRWDLGVHTPAGVLRGMTDRTELVRDLLALMPAREVVYSCGVGDDNPIELPDLLADLASGPEDRARVLFHDFFPLSPSYTLLDADGRYRGPLSGPRSDRAHLYRRPDGSLASLEDWQGAWRRFADLATELRVFSEDSAMQVAAVWPHLAERISVRPHAMPPPRPVEPPPPGSKPVIGVLGNIGVQKGAAVVQALARRGDVSLVIVGNIDPAYALPGSVKVTGTYKPSDIPNLATLNRITHWLIPSIWPETFSYTTHEAIATGLPVMAFDLGAQGAAVRDAPNGLVLPFGDGEVATLADQVRRAVDRAELP